MFHFNWLLPQFQRKIRDFELETQFHEKISIQNFAKYFMLTQIFIIVTIILFYFILFYFILFFFETRPDFGSTKLISILIFKDRSYYGLQGIVLENSSDLTIQLEVTPPDNIFLATSAMKKYYSKQYFSMNVVAKKLNIPPKLLSKVFSFSSMFSFPFN